MLQLKKYLWLVLLALSLQGVLAFSLLGPVGNGDDAYQQTIIGYNQLQNSGAPPFFTDPQFSGPKNLGEEYRRNVPVVYYAADSTFLDYFGSNGLVAMDQTFAILNGVLTNNIDNYSGNLTEFPLDTMQPNYEAEGLGLLDLKSEALHFMTEQLGLADAVRYTWALHDRYVVPPTPCPGDVEYTVITRNFDIISSPLNQLQSSPYVNGVLYDYFIYEDCGAPAPLSPPDADALEFPADPLENNPPVSSIVDGLLTGYFYTGLTRDDVAGLRYLLSSNNINTEAVESDSQLIVTNTSSPTILTTMSLQQLYASAQTNSPSALETLFPGLEITSTATNYSFVNVPNVITYLQNLQGAPVGSVQLVTLTNGFTPLLVTNYTYTFGNVITNGSYTNVAIITETIQVTNLIGAPYGAAIDTLISTRITHTNGIAGDFYLLPTNVCSFTIITNLGSQIVYTTNTIVTATPVTNGLGSAEFFQQILSMYTNHFLLVQEATCTNSPAGPALRPGIENIKFIRADFDSLLGQFFKPITNDYSEVAITNSLRTMQSFQRIITRPDFLFSAQDLASGPPGAPVDFAVSRTDPNFDQSTIIGGLAGPGIITSPANFTFTKVGLVLENTSPTLLTSGDASSDFIWGSFDETTNAPVIYPNGTSIDNLGNLITVTISPPQPSLPNGKKGAAYTPVTFTATGGAFTPPITWSAPGGLPPGLSLSSGGTLSGTPTQSGSFDFVVQLTDSLSRTTTWTYSIIIN